jgi:hypothetical protein
MSNVPDPEPQFQPESQTPEENALWAALKMRVGVVA